MTEWGATDDVKAVGIDAATADKNLMGWTYWAYKHWDDPTTADASQGLFTDDADLSTVKKDKLRQLVRTYPQAVAGTPQAYRYDPDHRRLHVQLPAEPDDHGADPDLREPAHLAARVRRDGDQRHVDEERVERAGQGHLGQGRERADPATSVGNTGPGSTVHQMSLGTILASRVSA